MFGLSQLSRQLSHHSIVDGATGDLFRFRIWLSHHAACSRNVTPGFCCSTTLLKCSSESAPLFAMISFLFRNRSDADMRTRTFDRADSSLALIFSALGPEHPSKTERRTIYRFSPHVLFDHFGGSCIFLFSASVVSLTGTLASSDCDVTGLAGFVLAVACEQASSCPIDNSSCVCKETCAFLPTYWHTGKRPTFGTEEVRSVHPISMH